MATYYDNILTSDLERKILDQVSGHTAKNAQINQFNQLIKLIN